MSKAALFRHRISNAHFLRDKYVLTAFKALNSNGEYGFRAAHFAYK
jgi:hypothetical protein